MKRRSGIFLLCFLLSFLCVACGNTNLKEENVVDDTTGTETKEGMNENESNMHMDSQELLDLFINGSIDAVDSNDLTSTFNITDFNMATEEWDSYSVGERVDL